MKRTAILLGALLLALGLIACNKEEAATPAAGAPTMTMPPQPMGGQQAPHGMAGAGDPSSAGITYDLPAGWNRVAPGSSMRIDQATIPGAAGSAEMAVFFFGAGGGGGVEDNLQRWVTQVDSTAPAKRDTFEANGMKITMVDVSGTVKPSTTGMGPATEQPNSRMFAAVVEGDGGPWFFKVTGPEQTLAGQRDAFVQLLRSARKPAPTV